VNALFLSALMLGEEMILSRETQEKGTVMVHDLKGLSLAHARQFTLRHIKKFIAAFQVGRHTNGITVESVTNTIHVCYLIDRAHFRPSSSRYTC